MTECPRDGGRIREVARASDDSFSIWRCYEACHEFRVGEAPPAIKLFLQDPLDSALKMSATLDLITCTRPRCTREPRPGYRTCALHQSAQATHRQQHRERTIPPGKCKRLGCTTMADPGFKSCEACRMRSLRYQQAWTARKRMRA